MERPRKGSKGGAPPMYEESFKIAVAREYLSGEYSQSQLARKHGLRSGDVVAFFVRWYQKNQQQRQGQGDSIPAASCDTDQQLAHELRMANLKITALEMLIKNAEKELGVDIRKKSGTKPPVK